MLTATPSRFAPKSVIPPTNDAHPLTASRLPPPAPTVERFPDWAGRTDSFLKAAPEKPTAPAAGIPITSDLSSNFRHSGWAPFRRRVEAAMVDTFGLPPRRLAAFRACGSDAYVERCNVSKTTPHYTYRLRSTKCHDRFCVPCSAERSRIVRDNILAHTCGMKNMKLITLTAAQKTAPLADQLDTLQANFKKLRNHPFWKANVKGGASIIEHKLGSDGERWNLHYHVLLQCSYIVQKKLSELWFEITGDSYIVDIRAVGSMGGAVQYITKYMTKASDASVVLSPKHLKEALIAFTGRRMVATFGNWRGLQLSERYEHEINALLPDQHWEPCGSLDEIIRNAVKGDPVSLHIMRAIAPRKFQLSAGPPGRPDPL